MSTFPQTVSLFQQWAGQASWQGMDACTRGYYAQLVLMAAQQKPAGYLPDQEKQWRQWLGLPLKKAKKASSLSLACPPGSSTSRAATLNANDRQILSFFQSQPADFSAQMSDAMLVALSCLLDPQDPNPSDLLYQGYHEWIDHLWETRWRPQLLQGMEAITPELIRQIPKLKGKTGWWIPLAAQMDRGEGVSPELQPPAKKQRKTTGGELAFQHQRQQLLSRPTQIFEMADVAMSGLVLLDGDQSKWLEFQKIQRLWRSSLTPERRQSLWDVGVACLAQDPLDQAKARTFLGKLIGQYGETEVAKAVGDLATRNPAPADPNSFLQAILTRKIEGTPAEQKARSQRAKVAL